MSRPRPVGRLSTWLERWGGIVPLLLAEFIVWLGFGALLPVLPLYFTQQGVDLALLGLVIAAWPAARLFGEPVFGWLADRTARIPIMVGGLVATGIFSILPLVFTGPLAFLVLRAGAGLATAAYDPAARGYLTDATPPDRRGEAFGLYGAAQMGGLLLGPAIGALGAGWFGGISFVFVFGGVAAWLAALPIGLRGRESGERTHPAPAPDSTEFPPEAPSISRRAAAAAAADRDATVDPRAPNRLLNRGLIAALVINAGGYFAGGTYEGDLELVPPAPGRRSRSHRADVRDVRAAGAPPVAVRRSPCRSAGFARVHRGRLDPARRSSASPTRRSRIPCWPCRSSSSRRPGSRCSTPRSMRSSPRMRRSGARRPRRESSGRPGRSGSSWHR